MLTKIPQSRIRFGRLTAAASGARVSWSVSSWTPIKGRLLRAVGLEGVARRRFRRTADSDQPFPLAANTVNQEFVATPNQVWAADLTYLATAEGWLYPAVVLALCSRRVVGWAAGTRISRQLVLTALDRALAPRVRRPSITRIGVSGCQ